MALTDHERTVLFNLLLQSNISKDEIIANLIGELDKMGHPAFRAMLTAHKAKLQDELTRVDANAAAKKSSLLAEIDKLP